MTEEALPLRIATVLYQYGMATLYDREDLQEAISDQSADNLLRMTECGMLDNVHRIMRHRQTVISKRWRSVPLSGTCYLQGHALNLRDSNLIINLVIAPAPPRLPRAAPRPIARISLREKSPALSIGQGTASILGDGFSVVNYRRSLEPFAANGYSTVHKGWAWIARLLRRFPLRR